MARKAIFLDRDGVLNRERGEHTWRLEDFEVLPDVPMALARAQAAGWSLVVITNQSGIGLGLYGHAEVERLHRYLHAMLAEQGVSLMDILYCPHHPTRGKCLCRKPGSLLLERAIARHGLDPGASVFIGDRARDMEAASGAGVHGILVDANEPLMPVLEKHALIP